VKLDLRPRAVKDETSSNPGYGQPSGRNPSGSRAAPGVSFSTVLLSAVLSLLLGGVGAWAYQKYVAPRLAGQEAEPAREPAQQAKQNVADFSARVDGLAKKLDQLQSRVDAIPKPSPPPDIEPLRSKLSSVDVLSKKVDALGERLDFLPKKIDKDSKEIADLTAKIEEAQKTMASLRSELAARRDSSANRGNEPASRLAMKPTEAGAGVSGHDDDVAMTALLTPGVEQFEKKQYKEAFESFSNLAKSKPEDARVWYYAALARGFATGDWKGDTEKLVMRGVEQEKAGSPPKAEIDATFSGLTRETGKDWLNFYRRRAAASASATGTGAKQ
jgi:TolA-binding protein